MKFLQFTYKDKPEDVRVGYLEGDCVMDINSRDSCIPKTMMGFLSNPVYYRRVKELKADRPCCVTGLKNVILKPPIHGMDKLLCVDVNYKDYCEQHKIEIPDSPVVLSKLPSTVIGPSDGVQIRTDVAEKVDYEVELAVVMGKTATCIEACEAYDYLFGCTIAQDISARDWLKHGQIFLGKSMDTFSPLGPYIVTFDEIGDPHDLEIKCKLNGVYKQKSNTSHQILRIPELIEQLSSIMTLRPGDTILTGTPAGVGMYSKPPEYLKPGDTLVSEIEKIGALTTRIEKYCKPENWIVK